ncbi:poly(U)-specific 3'-to-5' RNA exonuclease [Microsporum audouinii]
MAENGRKLAMPLVQYSDTESEESGRDGEISRLSRSPKRPRHGSNDKVRLEADGQDHAALPPLPNEFRDLYSTSVRVSVQDDPSLHNGRTRAVPHVVGNWPTHIYLEWYPNNSELGVLSEIIKRCERSALDGMAIHSLLYSDLGAQLPLHISLSRPVVLLTEQRESFLNLFHESIYKSKIQPLEVSPSSLDWVSNFEHTRWFLVLRLNRPKNDGLNRLLRLSNTTLAHFSQPPLYENPTHRQKRKHGKQVGHQHDISPYSGPGDTDYTDCFHISIAWTLEEPGARDKERLLSIDFQPHKLNFKFNNVKVKIGNQIHSEALLTSTMDEDGFEGV